MNKGIFVLCIISCGMGIIWPQQPSLINGVLISYILCVRAVTYNECIWMKKGQV